MNILALDTGTECCSTALLYQGSVFERVAMTQRDHSDLILGMMDDLFEEAETTISVVDAIAFGRGPGSFTGVRVGAGVAQGIAFARDIAVIPISSLMAVAQGAADELDIDNIAVAMDARMGEIYGASYRRDNEIVSLVGVEQVCSPEKFTPESEQQWTGIGTGWGAYDELLRQNFAENLGQVSIAHYPLASSVLKLAQIEADAGRLLPAEQAMPVYLRDNVANKKGEQKGA